VDKLITESELSLYYRDEGQGSPVVLIHGFSEDGGIWDQLTGPLKNSCRLLIPDLPGSGRSSLLPGTPSIEALAEVIRLLLDREKIGKCILIGHSMGGYITLAFAEKYPERVRAFGLFHSTAYADSEEKKATRRRCIDFIHKNGAEAFIRQSTASLFSASTRTERPELIDEMISRYAGFSPDALSWYQEAMISRPDRIAVLQSFPGPVLFIIGAQDQAVPPEHSLQQCHIPRLSFVNVFELTGHEGMLEEIDRSNSSLHSFLNFVIHSSHE
jgi:pimeloyl-ACP methyl ester carboxylesterase